MNKKLSNFFSKNYGMEVNKKHAYGKIKDYEVNVTQVTNFNTTYPVRIYISFYATDEQKGSIDAAIRNFNMKHFTWAFNPYGLSLGFNDITFGQLVKRLPNALDTLFNTLSNNGALTSAYCPVCGKQFEEGSFKKCNIDGINITIDNECVEKINNDINEENKDFDNAPNNYLKGFAGALIGGLAGAAISVVLNLIGFVSSISAIVSVILGAFLFQKFGGKPNKMMIVIVSLTTLVLMVATIPTIYIVVADFAATEVGVEMTAIEAFQVCMTDSEFSNMFYADLALVILFTAIGIGVEIFVLNKQIKRKQTIK